MDLVFAPRAVKDLKALPRARAEKVIGELAKIAAAPFAGHANVDRLSGVKDGFRLRLGGLRALYVVDRKAGAVRVLKIKPRGKAYR